MNEGVSDFLFQRKFNAQFKMGPMMSFNNVRANETKANSVNKISPLTTEKCEKLLHRGSERERETVVNWNAVPTLVYNKLLLHVLCQSVPVNKSNYYTTTFFFVLVCAI